MVLPAASTSKHERCSPDKLIVPVDRSGVRGLPNSFRCNHWQNISAITSQRSARERSGSGGSGGDKLVAFDFGGYAYAAISAGFDAHDLAAASDIDFSGGGNFLW